MSADTRHFSNGTVQVVTQDYTPYADWLRLLRAVGADAALNPGRPDPDQSGFADGAAMPAGMER